jgi:hypothetical protein
MPELALNDQIAALNLFESPGFRTEYQTKPQMSDV